MKIWEVENLLALAERAQELCQVPDGWCLPEDAKICLHVLLGMIQRLKGDLNIGISSVSF